MTRTVLVVHLDIIPERFDEFMDIVREHGARCTRVEPGCLDFRVLASADRPGRVILVETYADDAAVQHHLESQHMQAYLGSTGDMVVNRERYPCRE